MLVKKKFATVCQTIKHYTDDSQLGALMAPYHPPSLYFVPIFPSSIPSLLSPLKGYVRQGSLVKCSCQQLLYFNFTYLPNKLAIKQNHFAIKKRFPWRRIGKCIKKKCLPSSITPYFEATKGFTTQWGLFLFPQTTP